jgi:hypothetical protein
MARSDDAPIVQARRAEIKKRYGRAWDDHKAKSDRIKSVRRVQVQRLLRDRHGNTLPDDAGGRAALQLLFELGLDGPTAHQLAPWADGDAVDRLIEAADAKANWVDWSKRRDKGDPTIDPKLIPERIGDRLGLLFEEYRRLELTHLRPGDVPRHVVEKYLADRRAKREADRKRRKREQAKRTKSALLADPRNLPDGRAKSLALVPLADRQWWTVRRLAEFAREHLGAFGGLDHRAARQAALRAVDELRELGIVETKIEAAPRGLKETQVRRLMTADEIAAEDQQLLAEVAAEQGSQVSDVGG